MSSYDERRDKLNALQIFNNSEFGEVRTVEIDNKPYFVASDIANALGYSNTRDAISRHCKGVVKCDIPTNSGVQNMSIIPEGDVYRLVIRSNLPSAERFEQWVFDEVLPQIRQTGSYEKPMTQLEIMQMSINQLVEQDKRMNELEKRMDMFEAKSLTVPNEYFTVAGFASIRNRKIDMVTAKMLGKKAAKLSKEFDYPIGKVPDERFGHVNTYHVDILNKVM